MSDEFDTSEPHLPEALLAALRAPGTAEELAGEQDALSAFRAARAAMTASAATPPTPPTMPTAPGLRLVGQLSAGGVAMVSALALGTGVAAAAYTNTLPHPVQQFAHSVLAPIGVPAAHPRVHRAQPPVTALPSRRRSSAAASPTSRSSHPSDPTRTPSAGRSDTERHVSPPPTATPPAVLPPPTAAASPTLVGSPTATAGTPTGSPSASPTSTSSSSPTSSPTTPPKLVPASLSLTLSATRVDAGSTVSVAGSVADASGKPVGRQRVSLQASTGAGWVSIVTGRTSRLGTVSLMGEPITQNTRYRLRLSSRLLARPLLSSPARVSEVPVVTATYSGGVVRVSVPGAQPGDQIELVMTQGGHPTVVGSHPLDSQSSASFTIQAGPQRQRYVVLLPRTSRHANTKASVTVPHA